VDLSLEEARARVLAEAGRRGPCGAPVRVAAARALGRWLAEPVHADRAAPPWPRAMRDGYAVRAADGLAPRRVTGMARAGEAPTVRIAPGECAEIMTGAIVPEGADSIIMVEHAQRQGETVSFERAAAPGDNIAAPGAEYGAGDELLPAGRRLDAAALAVLASVGLAEPRVYPAPRVALLATGDELAEAFSGAALGPAQIRNCNAPALAAMCALAGAEVAWTGTAADEPSALGQRVEEALAAGDVLVLSGGVSKGRFDFVPEVLAERGGAVFFHGVRIRPGRPVVFGKVRERLFFGLPGNPLSAMLTFELFVRPALALLAGAAMASVSRPYFTAEMGFEYRGRALPLELFLPVRFEGDLRRARVARVSYHGSADVVAWAAADGYLAVPEGTSELAAGSAVSVLPK